MTVPTETPSVIGPTAFPSGSPSFLRRAAGALALDRPLLVVLVVYLVLWLPLAGRSTASPALLACFNDDEPVITQQLVGMTVWPYGNPANYLEHPERRPAYWGRLAWPGLIYYGGTYLGAAYLAFAPLKLLGLPDFPAAPTILRLVTLLSGVLALVLLYNLGRRLGSRWIGLGAAVLLMGDFWFNWYSSIIHPDMTLMMLGLLALWFAALYVEKAERGALLCFAVTVGLAHGAKCGGPWLIPLAMVMVAWGQARLGLGRRQLLYRVPALVGVVGVVSLLSFALSTPYAFLDRYYFAALRAVYQWNLMQSYGEHSFLAWVEGYWAYQGLALSTLTALAFLAAACGCFRKDQPIIPMLSAVLVVSVVVWYASTVRYGLVLMNFLLPATAACALLSAWVVSLPLLWLRGRGGWWPRVTTAVAFGFVVQAAAARYETPLLSVVQEMCRDHRTTVAIGRWAEANLPHESTIVYYGMSYFDPAVFPNARWGSNGLVYYKRFEKESADYFVLDGAVFNAPHIAALRKTQNETRGQEGPVSVLFLQDVLDRKSPEAELVAVFTPDFPPPRSTTAHIVGLARVALGLDDHLLGQELRLYRVVRSAAPASLAASSAEGKPVDDQ